MTATDVGEMLSAVGDRLTAAWLRCGQGMVGWGEFASVPVGSGHDRIGEASAALTSLFEDLPRPAPGAPPARRPVAFASFTFDSSRPGSVLFIPAVVLRRTSDRTWLESFDGRAMSGPGQAGPAAARAAPPLLLGSSIPPERWMDAVATIITELRGPSRSPHAVRKVVLARDLLVSTGGPIDRRALVERLARRFPDCWTFLCGDLVGATPELLVRRTGDRVESLVLAASVPRGRDRGEDDRLAALLGSDKHQLEHAVSVSSVTETLGRVCADLEVDPRPRVLRYDNVQHLASWVRGTLLEPRSVLELIGLLHPTPAVCGTPTELAMDRIRKLEEMERDGYSGPVGWVDAAGDGEMCIALRCAQLTPSGARLFAGAGIVVGSEPASELEETEVKFRAILSCLEDMA